MDDVLYHLMIPDEEVETRDKKLMNITPDPGLDFAKHGATLSTGLQNIVKAYENLKSDSLSEEDLVIFKMIVPETSDIYAQDEEEKQAESLKKYLVEQSDKLSVDVQMMFVPNLPQDVQQRAVEKLRSEIDMVGGDDKHPKIYSLADGTAVIRADVPVRDLKRFTNDPVIYRVEQTGFFQLTPSSVTSLEGFDMQLDPSVDIR